MTTTEPTMLDDLVLFEEKGEPLWGVYLAGLLDGEGYIGLHRINKQRDFSPIVQVNMCDPGAISKLHERYGGRLKCRQTKRLEHRSYHEWRVTGRDCIPPLRDALPFLLVKRDQAILVMSVARGIGLKGESLHPVEQIRRRRADVLLRDLNRRGPR